MSSDIILQFIDAMAAANCAPHNNDDIIADGEDHYFRLADDRKDKRGAYCLDVEPDGFAHGNFVNHKTGDKGSWYSGDKTEYKPRFKEAQTAKEAVLKARHTAKAKEAFALWNAAELALDHPYLTAKRIQAHGARIDGDDLIFFGMSMGDIFTYQRIQPDGTKLYLAGARKKGCYYPLVSPNDSREIILICEGIATAASVREATGLPTVAAFDAPNLIPVTKEIRHLNPNAKIVICADNDHRSERNTGIEMARQAAGKYKASVTWPEFNADEDFTDFNDASIKNGIEYVRQRILAATVAGSAEGVPVTPSQVDVQTLGGDLIKTQNISPEWDDEKIANTLRWKKHPSLMSEGVLDPLSFGNTLIFLRHKLKFIGLFRYDRFSHRVLLFRQPPWHPSGTTFKVREIKDTDIYYMSEQLEKYGLLPGHGKVHEAIKTVATENWIDPPLEYFNRIVWDQKPRLGTWLVDYLGAAGEPDYLSAVGAAFCVAIVARQFEPGCKAENMLVLEGPQGLLKSTALKTLADVGRGDDQESYFCDTLSFDQIRNKDGIQIMQGKTIIEIPDLAGMGSREIEEIKQRMSIQVDEMRNPYGREPMKYPRRFVWAGSTNESHWLKDITGNRRFWPVECQRIDIDGLIENREQLMAEAVAMYKNKSNWWIGRENPIWAQIEDVQSARLLEDIWHEPVERFARGMEFVTIPEVLQHLKIDVKDQNRKHQHQVASILKRLGYISTVKRNDYGIKRGWKKGSIK